MRARLIQLLARYVALGAAALLTYFGVEDAGNIAADAGAMVATAVVLIGGVIIDHWFDQKALDKRKEPNDR